jgi:hypothetical protein
MIIVASRIGLRCTPTALGRMGADDAREGVRQIPSASEQTKQGAGADRADPRAADALGDLTVGGDDDDGTTLRLRPDQ